MHRARDWTLIGCLIFVSFLVDSAVRSPVPGVNEPHYLTKAKHFWNPEWCRTDFFLRSADAHFVFYNTVGVLTQWLTLEQTAWVGRILALALLSVGWLRLLSHLVPSPRDALWVTWVYLGLVAIGNFSGEWIVGGVEAKVFAYGLDFWALALLFDRRWYGAAICGGLAVSFHPVVGLWAAIGLVIASACLTFLNRADWVKDGPWSGLRGFLLRAAGPIAVFVVCTLPGIVPALRLVGGEPLGKQFTANYIQVFYRLQHHLDPNVIPIACYIGYAVLVALWLVVLDRRHLTSAQRWFHWFVGGAAVIALCGLTVGLGPPPTTRTLYHAVRMSLMKLYAFRLFDVMVPLAVSIVVVGRLSSVLGQSNGTDDASRSRTRRLKWTWFAFGALFLASLLIPTVGRNPSQMNDDALADWLATCQWISENTPPDAVFFTPARSWAFKWYAERAEYVAMKDCPQDANGIVEWNERLRYLKRWGEEYYQDSAYSEEEVHTLYKETGITHILVDRLGPFLMDPVYENNSFRVYRIDNL